MHSSVSLFPGMTLNGFEHNGISIIKGIQTVEDAKLSVKHSVDAIALYNRRGTAR